MPARISPCRRTRRPRTTVPWRRRRSGVPRHGTIAFAGRQVPLPAGDWIELVLVRSGGPHPLQSIVLGRTGGGQVTGILSLTAPPPMTVTDDGVRPSGACYDPAALASQHVDASADPLARECWVMRPGADLRDHRSETRVRHTAARHRTPAGHGCDGAAIADRACAGSARMPAGGWVRPCWSGRQPDGASRAEAGWMQRWSRLLHRGYDNAAPGPAAADPTAG